ncbi:MAG: hypothetical protein GX998_03615, partial [Firmicutes bacterium]|nr:hypothetical protein [Bacillota bacterium]
RRVFVRVDGPPTEVIARLHDDPGVAGVSVTPQDDEQGRLFEVQAREDADIRRDLFFAMADASWPILELKSHDMSLEDVFLELVTEEDIGLESSWRSTANPEAEEVNGSE